MTWQNLSTDWQMTSFNLLALASMGIAMTNRLFTWLIVLAPAPLAFNESMMRMLFHESMLRTLHLWPK